MINYNTINEDQIRNNYRNRDPILVDLLIELKKTDTKNRICFMDELLPKEDINRE